MWKVLWWGSITSSSFTGERELTQKKKKRPKRRLRLLGRFSLSKEKIRTKMHLAVREKWRKKSQCLNGSISTLKNEWTERKKANINRTRVPHGHLPIDKWEANEKKMVYSEKPIIPPGTNKWYNPNYQFSLPT